VLDAGDPVIGQRSLTGLAAGASNAMSTSVRLPAAVSPGEYYVIAVADALEQLAELEETNKVAVAGPFTVMAYQPELTLPGLTVPAWGVIGQPLTVTTTVRNVGPAAAGAFAVRFYLSRDGQVEASDPPMGLRPLGGLAAGAQSAASTALLIPATAVEGEYRVIAVVDAAEQQAERDETNNVVTSAPFSVLRRPPPGVPDPGVCRAARSLGWLRPASCEPDPSPPQDPGGPDE
jgi:subtilase family serine protease